MNSYRTLINAQRLILPLGLALVSGASAQSQFQYNPQDLLIGFRQPGSSDLVINAGSISNYLGLANGTTIPVSHVDPSLINSTYASLNKVYWSAGATARADGNPTYPAYTFWVTSPRLNGINTPGMAYHRASHWSQALTSGEIEQLGLNAGTYSGVYPASADTANVAVIASNSSFSYTTQVTSSGNYGTFYGSVESYTGDYFSTAGLPARADLYQYVPDTFNSPLYGDYLGYFTFGTDGTLTFTAGPASTILPPQPNITNISHDEYNTSVTFTTTVNAYYSVLYSPSLTTPNWTVVQSDIAGTGSSVSVDLDSTSDDTGFYRVTAYLP
jgi:hypothetical protein